MQFGRPYDPKNESEKRIFFKSLSISQKKLRNSGYEIVSVPAIRSWLFGDEPHLPKREGAAKFLHAHLLLVDAEQKIRDGSHPKLFADLISYLKKRADLPDMPGAPPSLASVVKETSTRPPSNWKWDQRLWEMAQAVSGTYQIIRPAASTINPPSTAKRFVLEIMSLNPSAVEDELRVRMYSSTQPQKKYIYSGSMNINTKYLFSMLSREYEDNKEYDAFRSIVLYIYDPKECLSGIMLRGVTGRTGKRAVGIPFVAIKSPFRQDCTRF